MVVEVEGQEVAATEKSSLLDLLSAASSGIESKVCYAATRVPDLISDGLRRFSFTDAGQEGGSLGAVGLIGSCLPWDSDNLGHGH